MIVTPTPCSYARLVLSRKRKCSSDRQVCNIGLSKWVVGLYVSRASRRINRLCRSLVEARVRHAVLASMRSTHRYGKCLLEAEEQVEGCGSVDTSEGVSGSVRCESNQGPRSARLGSKCGPAVAQKPAERPSAISDVMKKIGIVRTDGLFEERQNAVSFSSKETVRALSQRTDTQCYLTHPIVRT